MPISMFLPAERDRSYLQLRHACWMRLMPEYSCGSERTGGISKRKGEVASACVVLAVDANVEADVQVDVDVVEWIVDAPVRSLS